MALNKGFKQFLIKTGIFLALFVIISFIIGQKIVASSLLYGFKIFIYGGMGKILLFSIVGFVLLYRQELLKLKYYRYKKSNFFFLVLSLIATIAFYILELNIESISINWLNIILIHALFLSIFIFLGFGIYSLDFLKAFFNKFKKQISYFLIFGIIAYSLMYQVWKLWPYLSWIVTKISYWLLDLVGNPVLINKYTIIFEGFAAEIGEACSGIYSMFIFTALYLFAVILDWKKLNKKKMIIIFIPAVIGAFLVNILRVFSLFVIGGYVSEEIAIGLYHSYTGMIFFLIYFTIFWLLFYNWMKKPEFKTKKKKQPGKIKTFFKKIMNDSLYRNSIYMMFSTLIMSFLGFIFWMIATRLYSTENIGLATTIISIMGLITGLSLLGLGTGLIRFLPKSKNKNNKINTSFTLVILSTIIISTIFLIGTDVFSPKLTFIHKNIFLAFLFIFFMIFASLNSLINSIFIAFRNTKFILLKNTIFSSLKIFLLFAFVGLGAYGIFTSWMIALIIGFAIVFLILIKKFDYQPKFAFYDKIIKKIGAYSFGNYIAGFIGGLPLLILPILILNNLGAESAAFYYMSMMIAGLLFVIPRATSQSLFAEGSYNEKKLKHQVKKSIKIIFLLLIPGILIIVFFGQYILLLFGKQYATEGFRFLQLLAVSGVFIGINGVMNSLLKVRKQIKTILFVNILRAILIIGIVSLFLDKGLLGIGLGWIIGNALVSLVYLMINQKNQPQTS